jgi:hypothetical protein
MGFSRDPTKHRLTKVLRQNPSTVQIWGKRKTVTAEGHEPYPDPSTHLPSGTKVLVYRRTGKNTFPLTLLVKQ